MTQWLIAGGLFFTLAMFGFMFAMAREIARREYDENDNCRACGSHFSEPHASECAFDFENVNDYE